MKPAIPDSEFENMPVVDISEFYNEDKILMALPISEDPTEHLPIRDTDKRFHDDINGSMWGRVFTHDGFKRTRQSASWSWGWFGNMLQNFWTKEELKSWHEEYGIGSDWYEGYYECR